MNCQLAASQVSCNGNWRGRGRELTSDILKRTSKTSGSGLRRERFNIKTHSSFQNIFALGGLACLSYLLFAQ
jgi:hypothetical protein